jgi:RNA-binding protein YhbY
MKKITKFQIGKFGITPGVIDSLELALKNHKQVRISALKSSGRNRDSIKLMAQELVSKLKENCDYQTIGFTIILLKKAGKKKQSL